MIKNIEIVSLKLKITLENDDTIECEIKHNQTDIGLPQINLPFGDGDANKN